MRTTTSPITIRYMKDGTWSYDMSTDQFLSLDAEEIKEIDSVVISEILTRKQVNELIKEKYGETKT